MGHSVVLLTHCSLVFFYRCYMTKICVGLEIWFVFMCFGIVTLVFKYHEVLTSWHISFAHLLYVAVCHISLNSGRFNVHYSADEGFCYEGRVPV